MGLRFGGHYIVQAELCPLDGHVEAAPRERFGGGARGARAGGPSAGQRPTWRRC
ncbi:MAG: hypothetical protein R3B48_21520 [Kofleriaceae bacterium]